LNGTNISGATNSAYTYVPVNGNMITCSLTSNVNCASGNPATSNAITMTVNPLLQVSVSISTPATTVCSGTSVTFTAVPVNGGITPVYRWKLNGINIPGATNATYTYVPVNGHVITCLLISSSSCATGNPALSNAITMTVNPLLPVSVLITSSATTVCTGTSVTFNAIPVNGGTTPAYQWKLNGANITGATNAAYSYVPANGNVITCLMTSSATCTSGNPATSNAIMITVNPMVPVSVTIAASSNPICAGKKVTLTATAMNEGSFPEYQWKVNGTNVIGATNTVYTYNGVNNDAITCTLTSSEMCSTGNPATSNTIIMEVNPLQPVSVSITASSNPVCYGKKVVFNAIPVNGGTEPAYQWKVNGANINGGTNSTYICIPGNGFVVTCVLTSNAVCATGNPATSNAITMTVNPLLPVSVSITASSTTVCAGTLVTFNSAPVNGGTTPTYQWKVNGANVNGATNSTYTYAPANGNVVTCTLHSSETCTTGNPATSNAIMMTVNPLLPVSISITSTATNVCAGTAVTFNATPVNGGTLPAYQWKLNGTNISGATNAAYTYAPANGNMITCTLMSNAVCPTGNPATSNSITMTVNPLLPVSVSISASATTVCAGTSVTFTAVPVNGGTIPAYQWLLNGANISGATNAAYTYVPANGNVITCSLTSNAVCPTGNPATSNSITMTVNPLLPVSVSITASATTVCAGISVTFNATPVNGGTLPSYQWKLNGTNISGATNAAYTYAPANGNVITCSLTSNAICATGSPATSNAITITVNPLLPVSVSISASATTVCAGTSVTYTAVPVNGGTLPLYQWKLNGTNISGATNSAYTYVPANGNVITCSLTSNAVCPTGNPAISNPIAMTVNPLLPVSVSISASATNVCAGTSVTFTAVPVNGGTTPAYQWLLNGTNISGATNAAYTYVPANGNVLTCSLTSNAVCPTGNPATSNAITMTVNPLLPVSVSITASATTVCAGTSVTFTAVPVNGGTLPSYQWKLNGANINGATNSVYSYAPANGNIISCSLTSNAICATGNPALSNTIAITVNPLLPVSVSITASATTVCAGNSVTFNATPVNGGITPAYQWKLNGNNIGGATNSAYTYVPSNGNVVSCALTSSEVCTTGNPATSNAITVTVNPLKPVSVSIAASATTVCAGTSVTFNATPVNGGTTPAYQWKLNGTSISGATNAAYTFIPSNGNMISCTLTSSETCATGNPATSNTITITVNPLLPVSVSISATATAVCAGTSVTFTAVPVNGGTTPAYQWKVNGTIVNGATNALYTYFPLNGNSITCGLTSSESCTTGNPAVSNTVTMTVYPMLLVGSIAANQTICAQSVPAQLTGVAPLNGNSPVYQWQSSLNNATFTNINGATTLNYQPAALTTSTYYRLVQNATGTCGGPLPTNTVAISVNPLLPVSVAIAASANPVCGSVPVTFTATPLNGGTSPAYQWKLNGTNVPGATNATYTFNPANGNKITCLLTSSETCTTGNPALSNAVTMTVGMLLIPGTVSANQTICINTVPAQLTSTPLLTGTLPTYQWQSSLNNATFSNINGATMTTYQPGALTSTTYYRQMQNSSGTCGGPLPTNAVTITVNPLLEVSVSVAASANPVCDGSSVTYTAIPVNGGTNPVYQWSVNGTIIAGATNATYSFIPQDGNTVSCFMISSEMCTVNSSATSNTITMTVNPLLPVSVSITSTATSVCAGIYVTFSATMVNGGTAPAYQWNVNGTAMSGATNATFTYAPVNGDAITCTLTSSETCTTGNPATSNTITMTVHQQLLVGVSVTATATNVCAGTSVTFSATAVNGGTSPLYQWKVDGIDVTGATNTSYSFVPVNGNVITCSVISSEICVVGNPATSSPVTMTVNPLLPVSVSIMATSTTVCAGTPVTFNATPVNGGTLPAYQWKVNGTNITGATNTAYTYVPVNGDAVTCLLTSNENCTTGNPAISNAITMIINPLLPVSVSITATATTVCAGTSVTFNATPVNGGTAPAYQWKVNGTNAPGATNAAYTFVPANGNAITCVLTSSETCTTGNPATSNTVTMTVNPLLSVSVSISATATTVCAGTSVIFSASPVNGGSSPAYQWKVNGTNVTGATNASYSFVPSSGNVITCLLTSNATCTSGNPATSNAITMTVNPLLPVSVSIATSSTTLCAGTSATFNATPVNGGLTPAYQWKVNGTNVTGATNAAYTFVPVNGNAVTCALTSSATCTTGNPAMSNTVTMTMNPLLPVSVSITGNTTVCAGSSLTFTATPVNGGSAPAYQWKVNGTSVSGATNATYTFVPANNNVVTCLLTSNANCTTGNPATSNSLTVTVNTPLPVSVSIAASANPVLAGTSVTFTATPVNGGTTPGYQWKVNGTSVTGATSVTYSYIPVNNDVVTCVLTSNATCISGSPATSNSITMSVTTIPTTTILQNITVSGTKCYNATQTITVAGGTTTFTVPSGASATMIAGQKISYQRGTRVMSGGYMRGYITTNGQYCALMQPSMVSTVTGEIEVPTIERKLGVNVYPNPTNGYITLEINGWPLTETIHAELYSMNGIAIMSEDFAGETKYRISLMDVPSGLYFLRIVANEKVETIKIIKAK
jgi:hypothetical protein